jgi:hypothetical protein
MIIDHPNKTHASTCVLAEGTRQAAMAGNPSSATAKAADIAFYRSVIASCVANGQPYSNFTVALMALGTGGA